MVRPHEKIRGILAEKGIKNREIATLLNISEQSVSNKLNHRNGIDFRGDEIQKICNEYNIDANLIFFGNKFPNKGQTEQKHQKISDI